MISRQLLRWICAAPSVFAIITPLAWGQDKGGAVLEEVVVYARKIGEDAQRVPISMLVTSGQQLEAAQIVDFQDLTQITPGLTITSDDPTSSSIKMRGVGLSFFGLAADPGVVITVDEFPQSRIGSVFGAFLDVQQVEVLKGPQGTLYGRNAPNGVISVWSKRPDFDGIHGRMELSASTFNTYLGEAAVNLPIAEDTLAVRLAYIHSETDGYNDLADYETVATGPDAYTYVYSDRKIDADDVNGDTARATILYEPADTLTFSTRLNRTDYSNGLVSEVADGPMIYTPEIKVVDAQGDVYVANRDDNLMFQDNYDYSDYTLKEGGLRAEWRPEAGMLVSLSQYQDFDTELSETIDAKPYPLAVPRTLTSGDNLYTQELRWHSSIGDSINYLVGAYYSHQDISITYQQLETATEQLITVYGTSENESYAFFTNFEYELTDQWSFSLGGRYNEEEESMDSNLDLSAILPGDSDIKIGQVQDSVNDNNTSFSFKTRYQYDEDILFYFAWDTAYKSGGYNPQVANLSGFFVGNDNIASLENDFLQYPPEESEAFEIGMKSVWMDQRLLVNMAMFYQDFDNFQNFQAVDPDRIGGFSLGILINSADTVNTQGVELDVSWLFSDQWTISFAGSYANPTVDQWDTNFCDDDDGTIDPLQLYCPLSDGSRLNNDSKFTSSTQLNYRRPLGVSNMVFFSHLSYAFQGESGGDDDSSSGTLNMNVGIDVDNWSVKLWSKNLLDDKSFGDRTSESEVVDNFYLSRNKQPRTLGITAIYRFGGE